MIYQVKVTNTSKFPFPLVSLVFKSKVKKSKAKVLHRLSRASHWVLSGVYQASQGVLSIIFIVHVLNEVCNMYILEQLLLSNKRVG